MGFGSLISVAWLAVAGAAGAPPAPSAEVFVFRPADHREAGVGFELDAPLGRIEARAEVVEGELRIEGGRARGRIRVRVDGLRTGIEARDRDLRKPGWLDARRWPFVGFVFDDVEVPRGLLDGAERTVEVRGRFFLRGLERWRSVEMRVRLDPEDGTLRCEGELDVPLAEHAVPRTDSSAKALIGLRVGEVARVKLRLRGRRG